jgi:FkbM family methyltransferase
MKVAHFAKYGPQQSGLYETARELIISERQAGIEADLIDFDGESHKAGMVDRGVEAMPMSLAEEADIIVRHSAVPTKLQYLKPVVMALHGRPESSFRLEQQDKVEVITGVANKASDARYKAFITFWEEYVPAWRMIAPNISYVPAMVDLDRFMPKESTLESPGSPNLLIADMWREDVTPFNMILAASLAAEKLPQMKLHLVGVSDVKPVMPYLKDLKKRGILGHVAGTIKDIQNYYALADILITPHVIATRVIREASAMDVDIVAGTGCKYTPYQANPMDVDGFAEQIVRAWSLPEDYSPREVAEEYFNPEHSGRAMKRIFESVLEKSVICGRKIFVDLGGHTGETVRRFYREVPDAADWDIYTFEPCPEKLRDNAGFLPNVNIIDAVAGTTTGDVQFWKGSVNNGEGSTIVPGKLTGGLSVPNRIRSINFVKWLNDTVNGDDYVVVKMNIEGGEYPLMDSLCKNGAMKKVDQFYINTHSHKFPVEQAKEFEAIANRFKSKAKFVRMQPKGEIPLECV